MTTGALLLLGSFDKLERLLRVPGDRRKRLLAHAPRPRGRDYAHPQYALGRAEEVHTARDGPPAVSRLLEEFAALEPFVLRERRHIRVEPSSRHLEAQQCEPILEPIKRNEVAVPGHALLAAEIALRAEQAEWIEPRDEDLTLWPDHAIDFAQQLMRLVGEFERVRKHDQVDAVFREWEP